MRKRGLCLILLLALIVIPFISAQPPFQEGVEPTIGYKIEIPPVFILPDDDLFVFSFHVFNLSNGIPINSSNSNTECSFHLYNQTGSHLSISSTSTVDHLWDYEFIVLGGNFSSNGFYSYRIQCYDLDANLGGGESVEIEVTNDGFYSESNKTALIFGQAIFILLMFGLARSLSKKKWKLVMFFDMVAILMGVLTLNTIAKVYSQNFYLNTLTQIGVVIGIVISSVFFLYYFVSWTIELIGYFKKKKEKKWGVNPY